MKAAVFHAPGNIACDTVDDPQIQDANDIILKVTSTAICGSDLHIYSGGIPQARPMVMGHEFMGIVEETGKNITNLKVGDRVVVPFPVACGSCHFCQNDLPVACEHSNPEFYGPEGGIFTEKGGALFGYTDLYGGYDGGQAQYVRVPYAHFGPRIVPDNLTDEQVLFLTDIFPTGYTGVKWGELKGGESVAIFGAGPVGSMAAKSAILYNAKKIIVVDTLQYRLDQVKRLTGCETILWEDAESTVQKIRDLTHGRGADVCIDAVGFEPERNLLDRAKAVVNFEKGSIKVLEACMSAVKRGGIVSIVGVYPVNYDNFKLGQIFDKGITIKAGQCSVHPIIDELMDHVQSGRVVLDDIITHRLSLDEVAKGYEIFDKKDDGCVKVVLDPWK
ncbi:MULTISPECIES: zinc-dependent alcohol dehydrogenase [Chryseobacterium]|uniref:Threonine dehydrogenase-like Zn-dependent dehydrogenase n=1 Tax=Chryseobacterium camelliae TaxID=1265445 RepID=A0ABU0TGT0_9FLAO|nr:MULTISPECIES: zinc-dependent alcohol dehydrogenase [Chryseobacterium]MDT3405934.1 threonine dehydrogenase-like Zn-dependent dehydrogenase [Pseudacidovorax intermedius]MDQ1096262.1 threonine dehydrogenase-like Zn-dependent dehydrogenase [Chryseobacterium camelliae]MDQ1100199.1 threonine dehydrogenase-like Zn-dependent dehydrogenase [Chryseobacterium sp. SORGH_AS_1048]MDR6087544.1 threonine dehydrogenase-like Zn-dependent dehydrogenase [Chryseobacterium sp. SORGH_AS_0909]MDR6131918.1 threonin